MRIDLHMHTAYSFDCWMSLEAVMRAVQRNNEVDAVAVLDHDEIEGALRLAEVAPFLVIVGEEVLTKEGEIGGLFLYKSDNENAKEIARRHGIAVAAGSDAHFPWEIGRAGIDIAPFSAPQEFLENLRQGQIFGRRTPYIFAGLTYIIWYAHSFLKRF